MSYEKFLDRIIYTKELIEKGRTGTPKELANKLHVSESTVYRTINMLKRIDFPIEYNHTKHTYYFNKKDKDS